MQARVGPELLNIMIKQDEVAKFVAKKLGIREELIRSPQEMQEIMQRYQQVNQAAPQQEEPPQ